MNKNLETWMRLAEFYGKQAPEDEDEAVFTYASTIFCDKLMEDAYKAAELEYNPDKPVTPPQKVQDWLRAMWDAPRYATLRKNCEETAIRVIKRVPEYVGGRLEDNKLTYVNYVSKYPVSLVKQEKQMPDGWIYCETCKGDHVSPVCKLSEFFERIFMSTNLPNDHLSIIEKLQESDKQALEFYHDMMESTNVGLMRSATVVLAAADRLDYSRQLSSYLTQLEQNGLQIGQWKSHTLWESACKKCGLAVLHSCSLDRWNCVAPCFVTHFRPAMKDRPE